MKRPKLSKGNDSGERLSPGRKVFTVAMKTVRRLQDPYYQGKAPEIGFYFLFALVPIISLMLQLINNIETGRVLYNRLLEVFANNYIVSSILNSLQSAHSGSISLLFLVVALWSASKLEFSMIRLSNYTYQCDGENGFIGYFKARFRAIGTLILLIILIMVSLLALVYGNLLINMLNEALGDAFHIEPNSIFTSILRWPMMLFLYWLFIAFVFMMSPNEPLKLKEVIPGSLFAAAGILVATIAYYIYFEYFSHLNLVYGSLAAVIALLLWFYWLGYILVVGVLINASWFGRGEERYY